MHWTAAVPMEPCLDGVEDGLLYASADLWWRKTTNPDFMIWWLLESSPSHDVVKERLTQLFRKAFWPVEKADEEVVALFKLLAPDSRGGSWTVCDWFLKAFPHRTPLWRTACSRIRLCFPSLPEWKEFDECLARLKQNQQ